MAKLVVDQGPNFLNCLDDEPNDRVIKESYTCILEGVENMLKTKESIPKEGGFDHKCTKTLSKLRKALSVKPRDRQLNTSLRGLYKQSLKRGGNSSDQRPGTNCWRWQM